MTTNNTTLYNYKQKYLLFPPRLDRQSKSFGGAGIPLNSQIKAPPFAKGRGQRGGNVNI